MADSIIQLSNGRVALVDDTTRAFLDRWDWWEKNGYAVCRYAGKLLRMHRVILLAPDHLQVDHINGNTLDNRIVNLRLTDARGNAINRRMVGTKPVQYKGVYLNAGRYEARIKVNGHHYYLGRFGTPEEAAIAYDLKAAELHGEFAKLNFPNGAPGEIRTPDPAVRSRILYPD